MRLILLALALLVSHPAMATNWLRAETEHYVLHADMSEDQLREVAQRAEDFGRLLTIVLPGQTSQRRKLHLYLERNIRRISRVSDFENIGWTRSWPELSGAFILYETTDEPMFRNYTLFYVLAGNHLDNAFIRTTPPWVRVGVPLFFATAFVSDTGAYILGAPDQRRPMEGTLSASRLQSVLLTEVAPRSQTQWSRFFREAREAVYPLLVEKSNAGLLTAYLNAYAKGVSFEEASKELGDFEQWVQQVQERQNNRRPTLQQLTLSASPPAQITVRPMGYDEIALIEVRFQRLRAEEYEKASKRLNKLTGQFADSALVWYEYAAAEFERVRERELGGTSFRGFGFSNYEIVVNANPYSDAEAWRAVNRALELQPDFAPAMRLKAEIVMARLIRSGDTDDAEGFDAVRQLLAPIAADPEREPLAAAVYFQSFVEQGREPPAEAIEQLGRAFVANPGIEEFRYAYAVALSRSGEKDVARRLLSSMLNDPDYRDAAQRALDQG
jgi:tetratricopeptide (TPR) repeat protein